MKRLFILLLLAVSVASFSYKNIVGARKQDPYTGYVPKEGFVPDENTAKRIAEDIWVPIYGQDIINTEKPFHVALRDSIWVVAGHLKQGYVGGVAYIEIRKKDCKVLKVYHGK
jgi:hypothetical protein